MAARPPSASVSRGPQVRGVARTLDDPGRPGVPVHAAGGDAAAAVFLTYPLGLGVWLGFTDTRIGRPGVFIGLENYESLFDDDMFWLAVFNTLLYTVVATIVKFALGLWLALLLNNHLPFKSLIRAIMLLPWIVPTVLSAIAFWWIYDPQFSIISWALTELGLIDHYIDFLGTPATRGLR